MSADKRIFNGWTENGRVEDGALIFFGVGEEPREPFEENQEIRIEFSPGEFQTLYGKPSYGPTHVDWLTPMRTHIIFLLQKVEDGVWKIRFESN